MYLSMIDIDHTEVRKKEILGLDRPMKTRDHSNDYVKITGHNNKTINLKERRRCAAEIIGAMIVHGTDLAWSCDLR